MLNNSEYIQLVSRARLGNKESLNRLSEKVRGELSIYIYRIMLDFDLTEDILQDTLLEMVRSIKGLKDISRFKSWLYQIASTKIKKHYRISGNKRIMDKTVYDDDKLSQQAAPRPDALSQLLKKELSQAITKAMSRLKYNYRNVLILRCFEQMSYPDIAYTMGCSSIEAQLLFFRAKHSLKRQLQNRGYKKEHLLASLGIFAAITALPFKGATASAAVVAPTSMKVGALAAIIGAITTKLGMVAGVIAVTTALTVAVPLVHKNPNTSRFHIISEESIDQTRFKYPSEIAASFNPQGDYWLGTPEQSHFTEPVSIQEWLTKAPITNDSAVLIPEQGWISLKFASAITDMPGDDIIIIEKCKCGEEADVFLADCNGQEAYIGTISVPAIPEHTLTAFACDISELDLSFVPTKIRIMTKNPGGIEHEGALPGFDLVSVRANLSE